MPLPQVVIDTNVIVAGLRSRRGSAFQLLTLIDTGQFDIHLSVPLVLEYTEVLGSSLLFMLNQHTRCQDNILLTQKFRKFLKP